MNKLIILDLDGTLVDSLGDIHAAASHVTSRYGRTKPTMDDVRRMVGDGTRILIQRLFGKRTDDPSLDEPLASFHEYYAAHALDRTKPYAGIPEALNGLLSDGWTLGVLSNKDVRLCRDVIEKTAAFTGMFEFVFGGDSFEKPKPNPDPIVHICNMTGIPVMRTVMVGDSENDVLCGQAAGTKTVAAGYGFRDATDLKRLNPDRLIHRADELRDAVNQLFLE